MVEPEPTAELNRRWACRLVESCLSAGLDHFFLAPGSRCAPLTLAVARSAGARVIQHFDERGLAFACLGYGRASGRSGVFICTSGTAVANAWPAVVEASMESVPMLLLTADRPAELRETGANQTIDQQQIFGRYARFFFDLPCSDIGPPERIATAVIRQAALHAATGPAHINCMFREPLTSSMRTEVESVAPQVDPQVAPIYKGSTTLKGGNTLVIAGGCRPDEALAARRLANRLACPFLADITTGIRGLAYDLQLIRHDNPPPETVIHVGGRIVSKRWWQWLDQNPPRQLLQLVPRGQAIDPIHRVTQAMEGPLPPLCDHLLPERPSCEEFRQRWQRNSALACSAAQRIITQRKDISEPGIAFRLATRLPDDHGLFLGNSMPIRDMDTFGFWPKQRQIRVGANRGASGIDGLVGSALGFAIGLDRPLTAVVGDLSLLHDLNSLAFASSSRQPVVIVVINNDGGGIFHFLPVSELTGEFEQLFATPHGLRLQPAAELFDLDYASPVRWSEFESEYQAACLRDRSTLIEVRTNRHENLQLHRQIEHAVRDGRS